MRGQPLISVKLRAELKRSSTQRIPTAYVISKNDGAKYDIYRDGLKVHTTIDDRMQKYVDAVSTSRWGTTGVFRPRSQVSP